MSKKYIALKAIQSTDADGRIVSIEPKSDTHSGLFTADYTAAQEARLVGLGAIREPEGVEVHEKITEIAIDERREQLADAAEPVAAKVPAAKPGRKPKSAAPEDDTGESSDADPSLLD